MKNSLNVNSGGNKDGAGWRVQESLMNIIVSEFFTFITILKDSLTGYKILGSYLLSLSSSSNHYSLLAHSAISLNFFTFL